MKILLFGSTGMVGQGVLRECLADDGVREVVAVVRSPTGQAHPKLREIVHRDFTSFDGVRLDADACFWCLGVSSAGMTEADYARVTYEYTVAAVKAMNAPATTFVFVSGQGADGSAMWARVKKRTEEFVFATPFKAAYVFRPGMIEPLDGIRSRTRLYNALYPILKPVLFLMKAVKPASITDTRRVGRAMLNVARAGFPKRILGNPEINAAAAS
jgi:uncharacterized protein YbjT (DUF2867 family)